MTTFIRTYFPFNVQASVDSTTPDFRVSTDGRVEITNQTITNLIFTSLTFEPVATSVVTSTISPFHIVFRNAAGADFFIPVFASTST